MKFNKAYFQVSWNWFVVLPTIIIVRNEQMYYEKNFSIQFHWLGFHLRFLWIKENEIKDLYEKLRVFDEYVRSKK